MKTNYFNLIIIVLAAISAASLWRWAENGRYVFHGQYVIDSRTGEVTRVSFK